MKRKSKPLIYIASPYTLGDQALNVRAQVDIYTFLLDRGQVVPYSPLLSHFVHMIHPRPYEEWLDHCLDMLQHVDAMLSVDAEIVMPNRNVEYKQYQSFGRDKEESYCEKHSIPVFHSYDTLLDWVHSEWSQ